MNIFLDRNSEGFLYKKGSTSEEIGGICLFYDSFPGLLSKMMDKEVFL
jgi:hypothetical protein